MEFTRRFPHFAPYNAMLLHVQTRGIVFALRAAAWEKQYRRQVRPTARLYVILQPMGPVAFVFALSDTDPLDPANNRVPDLALDSFPTKGQPPPGALEKLLRACTKDRIQVEQRDFGTGLAGVATRTLGRQWDFHVGLNMEAHTGAADRYPGARVGAHLLRAPRRGERRQAGAGGSLLADGARVRG